MKSVPFLITDTFLDMCFSLRVTYKTKGGGFRQLLDFNNYPPTVYKTQYFTSADKTLSVEFKFDFHPPSHCGETNSCSQGETMLTVPDFVKVRLKHIES